MNIQQKWLEDQLAKSLWDAMTTGNTRRMRELLNPVNQAPTGLQTYLEPALSDGEKMLRKSYEPQQLGPCQPTAQRRLSPAGLGTAEAGDLKEET